MDIRKGLKKNYLSVAELLFIVGLAAIPLFMSFPYRVNIFLSWEGAYRMSNGEIPFRDFGLPLGGMYWVIPALFFKIFGAQMITLVKAQVFINILSGLAFRSILRSLDVQPGVRFLSVILYCISFSFFNFWPWYNHTVIVYELIALSFLLRYITAASPSWYWLALTAVFVIFSFLTKQDSGALALLLAYALLLYYSIAARQWKGLVLFTASLAVAAAVIIWPLTRYSMGYWFNHGQAPHSSRFSLFEILNDFFLYSQWMKFYLFIIVILSIAWFRNWKELLVDRKKTIFLLLTLGIIAEAAILQVTSYTPPDNNIFYHSFAFAFIFSLLASLLKIDYSKLKPLAVGLAGLMLWWSGIFWKYISRIAERALPSAEAVAGNGENVVNRKTYMISHEAPEVTDADWTFSKLPAFRKIYMPRSTVEGIDRLMADPRVKGKAGLKLLNMSELTPLATEIPFELEKGPGVPLWYHLGVAMFNKQADLYEQRIAGKYYDVVLFEHIPNLNNFYPFRVRDALQKHYQKIDSFMAPRRGDTQG
ncbi:MAG: hypothetical protein EOO09_16285, partial [Chitinophagaceae bacterium]